MKKDTIITLENGKEFILLDETVEDGKKYFFSVGYSSVENKTSNDYKFFEEIINNDEIYIQEVVDENLIKILLAIFTANYAEMLKEDLDITK